MGKEENNKEFRFYTNWYELAGEIWKLCGVPFKEVLKLKSMIEDFNNQDYFLKIGMVYKYAYYKPNQAIYGVILMTDGLKTLANFSIRIQSIDKDEILDSISLYTKDVLDICYGKLMNDDNCQRITKTSVRCRFESEAIFSNVSIRTNKDKEMGKRLEYINEQLQLFKLNIVI